MSRLLKEIFSRFPSANNETINALLKAASQDAADGVVFAATSTPPRSAPDARQSARLARLDAAVDSDSVELRNLKAELARLEIPYSRETGVDVKALRSVAASRGWTAEQKIRILSAAANVGLAE